MVAQGQYTLGGRLPSERNLCEQFRVSRGTVRQALADLEQLGIIIIKPGSGAYIKDYSPKELPREILPPDFENVSLADIVVARQAIEKNAIALACDNISPEQLTRLEELIDGMVESLDNLPKFINYDMAFHKLAVVASGNIPLVTAFEAISEYHKYSSVYTTTHEGKEEIAIDYHRRMLYALQKKRKDLAVKAVEDHLDSIVGS